MKQKSDLISIVVTVWTIKWSLTTYVRFWQSIRKHSSEMFIQWAICGVKRHHSYFLHFIRRNWEWAVCIDSPHYISIAAVDNKEPAVTLLTNQAFHILLWSRQKSGRVNLRFYVIICVEGLINIRPPSRKISITKLVSGSRSLVVKIQIFWNGILSRMVNSYRRFERSYYLKLEGGLFHDPSELFIGSHDVKFQKKLLFKYYNNQNCYKQIHKIFACM